MDVGQEGLFGLMTRGWGSIGGKCLILDLLGSVGRSDPDPHRLEQQIGRWLHRPADRHIATHPTAIAVVVDRCCGPTIRARPNPPY